MKKAISLILALVMLLSLTACGASQTTDPTAKPEEKPAVTEQSGSAEPADPHAEQVVIKVAANLKGQDPVENSILDQILLEKFNMIFEWENIEEANFNNNILLQFAGNDYPDIVWQPNASQANEIALTGKLLSIDEYEDQLPDFIKVFDEGIEGGWAYVKENLVAADGKMYILPSKNPRVTAKCWHYRAGTMMELGVIDSVEDIPDTVDEFVQLLKDIKAADPDSVPFFTYNWDNIWNGWDYAYNVKQGIYEDYFTGELVPYGAATNQWRKMLITLNDLYINGLMPQDYLSISEDQVKTNITNGVYYAEFNWAGNHTQTMCQDLNVVSDPNCGWIYSLDMLAEDDAKHTYDKETEYKHLGFCISNGMTETELARVLEFFNWTATEEGSEILSWGVEGITYSVDAEGNKQFIDTLHNYTRYHQDAIPNRNIDAVIAVSGPVNINLGNSFAEQGYGYFKNLNFQLGVDLQEDMNMIGTLLNDTSKDWSNQFIMGLKDPNNDADWQAYLDALEACGLSEWSETYTNYYNENMK